MLSDGECVCDVVVDAVVEDLYGVASRIDALGHANVNDASVAVGIVAPIVFAEGVLADEFVAWLFAQLHVAA